MAAEVDLRNKKSLIDSNLHVKEPHEIVLDIFSARNTNEFTAGKFISFKIRIFIFMSLLLFLKVYFFTPSSGVFAFFIGAIVMYIFFEVILFCIQAINKYSNSHGPIAFFVFLAIFTIVLLVLGST